MTAIPALSYPRYSNRCSESRMIGTLSRSPMYPTMPHIAIPLLFDAFARAVVLDLPARHFVEGRRHGLVRVHLLGERRRAVVELLGALGHHVDQTEFGVHVVEKPVEVAENRFAHVMNVPIPLSSRRCTDVFETVPPEVSPADRAPLHRSALPR